MREFCPHCHYPKRTCLCEHIRIIQTALQVIIIQHPKEATHAKNTAKLVALSIPSTRIIHANDSQAMHALATSCDAASTLLVYPCETSQSIEALSKSNRKEISTIVLIDGSWKQAFGIVKQNPWLQALRAVHFSNAPYSDYVIRHTSLAHALSTLEATAYSLSVLEQKDLSALHALQHAMQSKWQAPKAHLRAPQK